MAEESDPFEQEDESPTDDPVVPNREHLIQAYIQYSEESRYRDGLMHNSYYFILIASVIFAGNLLSLDLGSSPVESRKLWAAVAVIGVVLAGIGVVMQTYQRKRQNAEDQRQVLEDILNESFTKTGILKEHSSKDFDPSQEDNPFAVQETVAAKDKGWIERLFREYLPVSLLSKCMVGAGLIITVSSVVWMVFGL